MNHLKQVLLFIILLTGWSGVTRAQDHVAPQIVDVEVVIYMVDIDEVNSVAQSFKATVYVEFRWNDPTLVHPGPDSVTMSLEDIWYPHTQAINQQRLVNTFPRSAEVRPNGDVIFRQRAWGDFSQALELQHFPFDKQRLQVTLGNVEFGSKQVRYQISPNSGVSENLRIPDWEVLSWETSSGELKIGTHDRVLPAVVLSVDVKRHTSYFLLKVILPLMLIVAMSWMVFWIDPSMAASQISVAVTAMLTLIAYRFAIGGMVPRLGFLTSLDYFVMGSTIVVFVGLLEVVYTARLFQSGQVEKARAVDHSARWIVPLIFLVMVIETLFLRWGI